MQHLQRGSLSQVRAHNPSHPPHAPPHILTKRSDPATRFMFRHLARAGCALPADSVECRRCDGRLAGGFQDDGGVVLCANHLSSQAHTSSTLVHEAVHAFDQCRANIDWSNCVHHACSEIRAAALSGDCDFGREVVLRRNLGFGKQFQRCVRRRAEISVGMNPNCDTLAVRFQCPISFRVRAAIRDVTRKRKV